MAAELIGTVYVRVKPITAGLGRDISDAMDKGIKDAQADIDKSSEASGEKSGQSYSRGMSKGIADGKADIADGIGDALNSPDVKERQTKAGDDGGKRTSKTFREAFARENKKNNPFKSLGKSLRAIPIGKIMLGVFAVPAIGGAVKLIGAYLVGLVAALGSVAEAAAGAGAALLGAFAGLAPGLAVIMLGFKTESEALTQFKDAVSDLAGPWQDVGKAIQTYMLPGLAIMLEQLTTLAPIFQVFAGNLGKQLQDTFLNIGDILTSDRSQASLVKILQESSKQFDALGGIVENVAELLLPLFAELAPLGTDFLNIMERLTGKFRDFVIAGSESGALSETLNTWWERSKLVFGALSDVAIGLWNILSIGSDVADESGALAGFREWAATFREWTVGEESINKIKDAFANGMAVFREVNGLFADILRAFGEPLSREGGMDSILEFVRILREQTLPWLVEFSQQISGQTKEALFNFIEAFGEFISTMAESGSLAAFLETLTTALGVLSTVLTTPGIAQAAAFLLPLVGVLRAMAALRIDKLASMIWSLGAAIVGALGAGPVLAAVAVVAAIGGAFYLAYRYIEPFREAIDAIVDVFQEFDFGEALDNLLSGDWAALGDQFSELGDGLKDAFGDIDWRAIGNEMDRGIRNALSKVGDWLAGSFIPFLGDIFRRIPTLIGDALRTGLPALGAALGYLLGFLIREGVPLILKLGVALVKEIPGILVSIIAALDDVFIGIVKGIGGFLAGLVVGLDLDEAFVAMFDWFKELPSKIMEFIGGLADAMGDFFGEAWSWISGAMSTWLGLLRTFYIDIPVKIITWLGSLAVKIGGKFAEIAPAVARKLSSWLVDLLLFFVGLPGKIVGWIGNLGSTIGNVFRAAWSGVKTGINWLFEQIKGIVTGLPGKVVGWVAGIGSSITASVSDAILSAWNSVVGRIGSFTIDPLGRFGPGFTIDLGSWLKIGGSRTTTSSGGGGGGGNSIRSGPIGAFRGPTGGASISPFGATQTRSTSGGTSSSTTYAPGALVKIENATFNEPTDIDMLVGKIRFAYNSFGGT